jgi:hypothetical protein
VSGFAGDARGFAPHRSDDAAIRVQIQVSGLCASLRSMVVTRGRLAGDGWRIKSALIRPSGTFSRKREKGWH